MPHCTARLRASKSVSLSVIAGPFESHLVVTAHGLFTSLGSRRNGRLSTQRRHTQGSGKRQHRFMTLRPDADPTLLMVKRRVLYIGDYETRGPADQIEANTRGR